MANQTTKKGKRDLLRYSRTGRIRSIKPEMPDSQSMQAIEPLARYFYVQTWPKADDEGRLSGRPDHLRATIFPTDGRIITEYDIVRYLNELEAEGCLLRYRVGNKMYIQLLNFTKHQKIDKFKSSLLPPPPAFGYRQMELGIDDGPELLLPHEVIDERQVQARLEQDQQSREQWNEHPDSQH